MTTMVDGEQAVSAFIEALVADSPVGEPIDDWARLLHDAVHLTPFESGDVLVEHHALADSVHFLVEGTIHYQHLVTSGDQGETVSHEQIPWMPVGWSSLHLRRYRVTTVARTDGFLLTLPFSALQDLEKGSPTLWAVLVEFMFRRSMHMLWEARGVSLPRPIRRPSGALTPAPNHEHDELADMYLQSASLSPLPEGCRRWLAEHSEIYQAETGTRIVEEAEASEGLWLLMGGRVALSFTVRTDKGEQTAVRYAVRPGTLLCWSAASAELPAPYRLDATRSTTFAFVPRVALLELLDHRPAWFGALFEQQLWQLRNYLLSTRAHYTDMTEDGGIGSLRDLIEDSKPTLPVNSLLYGVPYLLENRLTRQDGFRRLYEAHFEGTESERVVANLALDLLRQLERSHRFFEGMQSTYAAVVRNQDLPPGDLRKVSSRSFRDALSHVPYVIKGLENLPDDPNCIFIYNHMAYAEDSILPNGFLFNPDSHFVSAMVLEPKYGDGIRIARTNAITEFWRADYYERLGHIPVATPESGWIEETPEEKQLRKDQFLADCQAVLASGRPFAIAPEGTITEEESVTERSPGPFKAGAFLMAGRFPGPPTIVPVALANFDKPAYNAVFTCVIKPAFTMEERGVDVNERGSLGPFLTSFRDEFRGYVEEAIELARYIETPEADLTGLSTNLGDVDAVNEEFEHDVRALELRSARLSDGAPKTVFYGSSTIRQWRGLTDDVGIPDAINLGFGGSTFEACRLYFERLVLPHRPARLVVYAGDNDISRGASAETVATEFRRFADMVQTYLPESECWFISIKPSPGRREYLDDIERANRRIESQIDQREQWRYVDWFRYMLDERGEPNPRLFTADQVHVNIAGYGILAKLLRSALSGDD